MNHQVVYLFLRFAIAATFLSAVADRLGYWAIELSVWGNWANFVEHTSLINPWFPDSTIPFLALTATIVEVVFAICLLVGFKTKLVAKLSGVLLLIFGVSMSFSTGIKGAFDYSVFTASAAAFALGLMNVSYFEIGNLIAKKDTQRSSNHFSKN